MCVLLGKVETIFQTTFILIIDKGRDEKQGTEREKAKEVGVEGMMRESRRGEGGERGRLYEEQ